MTHTEILKEFRNQPPAVRNHMIYELISIGSISYAQVSALYVASLENQKDEDRSIKAELATCLMMETVNQREKKTKDVKSILEKSIHRTIAILDLVGVFQLDGIKKKYNYQESVGKEQGIFWSTWRKE